MGLDWPHNVLAILNHPTLCDFGGSVVSLQNKWSIVASINNIMKIKSKFFEKSVVKYSTKRVLEMKNAIKLITVASKTLEGVFLPNNSINIHHRTLKLSAMCFYWPVWHFNFFDLFDLLSTMTYFYRHESWRVIFLD